MSSTVQPKKSKRTSNLPALSLSAKESMPRCGAFFLTKSKLTDLLYVDQRKTIKFCAIGETESDTPPDRNCHPPHGRSSTLSFLNRVPAGRSIKEGADQAVCSALKASPSLRGQTVVWRLPLAKLHPAVAAPVFGSPARHFPPVGPPGEIRDIHHSGHASTRG